MRKKRVRSTIKAFISLFRVKLAEGVQYRLAALAGAATSIFWAIIEITVYTAFYQHGAFAGISGTDAGMALPQAVTYAWLAQFFVVMQPMSMDSEILEKITSGDVGIELCRPLGLFSHWLAKNTAARLSPLFIRGGAILLVGLLMPPSYRLGAPVSLQGLLCAILSACCAFCLCAAFANFISAVRLNVVWGDGPIMIIILISNMLSGAYLPLQLWPAFMQKFLLLQPFAGYLDFPVRFYTGTMEPANIIGIMALQLGWTAFFLAAGKLIIRHRLKSIVVQGG